MAEKNIDYKHLLGEYYGDDRVLNAAANARNEDEEKWLIQKELFGLDKWGRPRVPQDATVAVLTEGWPKREQDVATPFAADILSSLGIKSDKDKNGLTAREKFIELYKSQRGYLEDELAKNVHIGKDYAKQVLQNTFRQAVKDQEQIDVQKAREDAMSMKWDDPASWYASAIGHTLLRNMYKAGLEGRSPTLADIGSDVAENALFAVPGGQYAKVLQLSRLGALGKGGKYAGRILGEAVAPFANEGAQYMLHNTDALEETGVNTYNPLDEGPMFGDQERTAEATFSPERALMGTLTNNAVGIGMYRMGAKSAPVLTGDLTRGANSKALREGVEGAKTAGDVVREAEEVAKNYKNFKSEDGFKSFLEGESKGLDKEALNDASGVLMFNKKAKEMTVPTKVPQYRNTLEGYVEELLDHNGIEGSEREIFKKTLMNHPQLATLLKSDSKAVNARRLYNSAVSNTGAARSEVVNKYGSQKDANLASSMLGLGKMDDLVKNQEERELKNKRAVENRNIMDRDDLDETDRKYLQQVIDNPDMMKFSNDTGFKLWLMTRGNDLLRGTSYHRPTWEVE